MIELTQIKCYSMHKHVSTQYTHGDGKNYHFSAMLIDADQQLEKTGGTQNFRYSYTNMTQTD
jgi:hypothetical protein